VEGKTGQATVSVSPVPVASVRLTPRTAVLDPGATRQLTAVALDADGNVLEGRAIEWTTDAAAVATVSAAGLVQAVASGYADIRATIEGKWSTTAITVATPEPTEQYDLVYERRAFNQLGEIHRLSPSTGVTTKIPLLAAFPGTYARDATPSPDGTRIAFTFAWYPEGSSQLDGEIYVASIDGTNMIRLTNAEGMDDQPVWSPDGTRIAFRSVRSGHGDIWVMGANGTGQTNLTNDFLPATSNEHSPAWSPDGSRIVLQRHRQLRVREAVDDARGWKRQTAGASGDCGHGRDRHGVKLVAGRLEARVSTDREQRLGHCDRHAEHAGRDADPHGRSAVVSRVVTGRRVDRVLVESRESDVGHLYDEARRDRAGSADERRGFPLASTLVANSRSGRGRALGVGSTGSESF